MNVVERNTRCWGMTGCWWNTNNLEFHGPRYPRLRGNSRGLGFGVQTYSRQKPKKAEMLSENTRPISNPPWKAGLDLLRIDKVWITNSRDALAEKVVVSAWKRVTVTGCTSKLCGSLWTLKEERRRIDASCAEIVLTLTMAARRSVHLASRAWSLAVPRPISGVPRRMASAGQNSIIIFFLLLLSLLLFLFLFLILFIFYFYF